MKDIPIIFSVPMVRALLDGRKTMTRRLAWRPLKRGPMDGTADDFAERPSPWQRVKPGDRLWVREAAAYIDNEEFGEPSYWQYRADTDGKCFAGEWPEEERDNPERPRWKPAIHMPRRASRLTLIVTGTKVGRLQEITESDAIAEGARRFEDVPGDHPYPGLDNRWSMENPIHTRGCLGSAKTAFGNFWIKLHGDASWFANPEVVALTFTVHKCNIDELPKAEAA